MMTTILEKIFATDAKSHDTFLAEYRKLLSTGDPKNADRLIAVAEKLGFPLDRLEADQAVVQRADRLKVSAGDLDEAEAELQTVYAASEKHGESMTRKIANLKVRQAELDTKLSAANGRAQRAVNSTKWLAELRAERSDLFPAQHVDVASADTEKQDLADKVAGLRNQLAEAQDDLAAANQAVESAKAKNDAVPPRADTKKAAIAVEYDSVCKRNSIASTITNLHMRISQVEAERRQAA